MIERIRANKVLSFSLLLSVLFFLRKGWQYAAIGNYAPLLFVVGLVVLLMFSGRLGKAYFRVAVRVWAVVLILWAVVRIVISVMHLFVQPFDGSYHLTTQFNGYNLLLSALVLILGVLSFRAANKKRMREVV